MDAVLRVHNVLCAQIDSTITRFCDEVARAAEYKFRDESRQFGIMRYTHFKLQPLFGALCIVIVGLMVNATRQNVYFVSMGDTSRLSRPICLEGLEDDATRFESGSWQVVTTSLPEAIDFVRKLEKKERQAGPDSPDLTMLDSELGGIIQINSARKDGCTGADLYRPSAAWFTGFNVASREFR